jgi:hypothetical protein
MRLISLAECARQLGISEPTARKIASQIPGAVRINKRLRYRSDSVAEFIAAGGCSGKNVVTSQP